MDVLREHDETRTGIRRHLRGGVLSVITAGALVFLVHAFMIQIVTVSSASMSPTLLPGDFVLANRLVYHLHPPQRGDIIALRFPQADDREFMKRVIGLPGDVVLEQGRHFYVNGVLLAQAQTIDSNEQLEPEGSQLPRLVPAGRLYVLGDNSEASLDSRFWGTVDERDVIGKASFICWSRGKHWWEVRWNRIGRWLP
jgi:signal peptidase I